MRIDELKDPRDRDFCRRQEEAKCWGIWNSGKEDNSALLSGLSDQRAAAWLAGEDVSADKYGNDGLNLGGSRQNEIL